MDPKSLTAGPNASLAPAKSDPIPKSVLATKNGVNGAPIWVAVKGLVFDCSAKPDMYGPGAGYHVFAGKDGSKALGLGSLKSEDAVADYSSLGPDEMKTLNNWLNFFQTRYNQVGVLAS